ncbi:SET and MYND domain-containing protein 4-like [Daphnia pulicaria]|uniref:SET and MYND domain-containing protein 4-like n=1 Tax=Daphnia pulicaria TaxID=35523 RepID=UPI001EE9C690|nr:SET and MYND domain-containing protein 4-like [Daphnia pulicaria]
MDEIDGLGQLTDYRRLCSDLTLQTKKEGFFKDYLSAIVDQVSDEEFEGFTKQQTDRDRVVYCWTLPALHKTMKSFRPSYRGKSADESIKRREQGNEAFREKDYRKALVMYNQSVVYAPYSSLLERTTLALALANRSAVLVHLKEFALAIRDIQLSLQSNYPEKQRYKLYDRMGYCHQQLGETAKARLAYTIALDCLEESDLEPAALDNWRQTVEKSRAKLPSNNPSNSNNSNHSTANANATNALPELVSGANSNIPNASKSLAMEVDDNSGRYYVAADDIKPGQTLVCEKPYAACLLPGKFTSHCHHCFVRLIAPLGCLTCRGVFYCSVECRDEAASTYHQYECGIIDYMIASGSSILSWIALRILTKGKMEDFLEAREELEKDGDGGRLLASARNPDSYSGIYHLATLSHLRSDKDFFDRTFMALFLFQCLRASGYLQTRFRYEEDSLNITEDEIYFASLLLRHLQLLQFNAHEIHEFVQLNEKNMRSTKTVYIGVGIYPTVAFFNHSCRPDVARYFLGTTMVITSTRCVKRGQMVAENYGPIFTHKHLTDRQQSLQGRYWFNCQCLACQNDWPVYDGMTDMETILTCCPLCRGTVQSVNDSYARCLKCKKQSLWEAIRRPVAEITTLYQTAMRLMDLGQVEKAIRVLGVYIEMMETLVADVPVRELLLAQEALRLCLGTYGTKYCATTHLTMKAVTNNTMK